jgi:hypothetical protein
MQHAEAFINETFNFEGKEYLKPISKEYFERLYRKAASVFRYQDQKIRLKLRDCGARDIFGNTDVCSYEAPLELIRRNPDNAEFVSVGGIYDAKKLCEMAKIDLKKLIFKIYTFDGGEISNIRLGKNYLAWAKKHEELSEIEERVMTFIYFQTEQLQIRIQNYVKYTLYELDFGETYHALLTNEEFEYYRDLLGKYRKCKEECVGLSEVVKITESQGLNKIEFDPEQKTPDFVIVNENPTNDLSSRMRTYLSCLIFQANSTRALEQTKLINLQAKGKLMYMDRSISSMVYS